MIEKKLEQILIGTILGDGHIQKTQAKTNRCRLRICHSSKQKDYLYWKYYYFQSICPSEPRKEKNEESYLFYTFYSDDLKLYHNLFYEKTEKSYRKKIDPTLISFFKDPLSLAVWYLDDGSFRKTFQAARIATNSFSLSEILILQEILQVNFGIPTNVVKAGKSRVGNYQWYNLSFNARDQGFSKLKEAIYEIVLNEIPSMLYKLEKPRND
jgi:hypothetical protein